jgi:hypothetical protein
MLGQMLERNFADSSLSFVFEAQQFLLLMRRAPGLTISNDFSQRNPSS